MIVRLGQRAGFPFLMNEAGDGDGGGGRREPPEPEGIEIELDDPDDDDDDADDGEPPAPVAAPTEGERPPRKQRRAERGGLFKQNQELLGTLQQMQQRQAAMENFLAQQSRQQPAPQAAPAASTAPDEDAVQMERITRQKADLAVAWNARAARATQADFDEVMKRSRELDDDYNRLLWKREQRAKDAGRQPQGQQYSPQELAALARWPDLADQRVNQIATAELVLLHQQHGRGGHDLIDLAVQKARERVFGQQQQRGPDPNLRRQLSGMPAQGGGRTEAPASRKIVLTGAERSMADAWAQGKNFKNDKEKYTAYHKRVIIPRNEKAAKRAEAAKKTA